MISNEELKKVKIQLVEQIKNTFPEDKKNSALEQIESMDDEQFTNFLEENNLLKDSDSDKSQPAGIFRAIVSGKIPSTKIDENASAIAVLEINPFSKGHIIIIPKESVDSKEKLSKEIISLSEKLSKKLKTKLKAKEIKISYSNDFGELIINLIPLYNESDKIENLQKYKAEKSELEEVEKMLLEKPKKIIRKNLKKEIIKNVWLPKRIP